jgi:hypothetical protein
LFAAVALMIGSPEYMVEAMGFGRPVSPLLLWVMIEAVSRRAWAAMAPPVFVSLSVSLVFASRLLALVKGVLGR